MHVSSLALWLGIAAPSEGLGPVQTQNSFISLFTWASQGNFYVSLPATDSVGNLYYVIHKTSNNEFCIVKTNSYGVIQWQKLTGVTNSVRKACSIRISSTDKIWVTVGEYLLQINLSGSILSQTRFNMIIGAYNGYFDNMFLDSSDNIYLLGMEFTTSSINAMQIIKLNSSGAFQWSTRRGVTNSQGKTSPYDVYTGLVVDSSSNVWVTTTIGYYDTGPYNQTVVIKLNSSGVIQSQTDYRTGSSTTYFGSSGIDSSNNIYIKSGASPAFSAYTQSLTKLDSSGGVVWTRSISYPPSGYTDNTANYRKHSSDIVVDSSGNSYMVIGPYYVTGGTLDASLNMVYNLIKYNSSGTIQWQRSITINGYTGDYSSDFRATIRFDYTLQYLLLHMMNGNGTTVSNFIPMKLPIDGSRTGTYSIGDKTIIYATSSLSDSAITTVIGPSTAWGITYPTQSTTTSTIFFSDASFTVENKYLENVVIPASGTVSEGTSLTFTVNTSGISDGTTLYYNLNTTLSTATTADFTSYSGSFTITSNAGSFSVTLATDIPLESEVFYMDVKTGSITGTVIATSVPVNIYDVPTYGLTPGSSTLNEGESLNFTVTTSNLLDGTVLYFNLNPTSSAGSGRFSAVSGSCTITSNASSFTITANNNNTLGDGSTFKIDLLIDSINGTVVATSSTITLVDISNAFSSSPSTGNFLSPLSISYTLNPSNTSGAVTLPITPASPGAGFTNPFKVYPMIGAVLGARFTNQSLGEYFPSLRWTGGRFVAATNTAGVFGQSTDGVNWDYIYPTGDIRSMVKSNSLWVAVGASGLVKTSSDLITWTTVTAFTSNLLYDVEWTGTSFIAVGYNGDIFRSTNGTSWTTVKTGGGTTTNPLVGVRALNGKVITVLYSVASASGTTFGYVSSDDGVNWTGVTKPAYPTTVSYPSSIVYGGSQWVVSFMTLGMAANLGTFWRSTDTTTWTAQVVGAGTSPQLAGYQVGPIWTGTYMVYLSRNNTNVSYSSTPFSGADWSPSSYDNQASTVLLRAVAKSDSSSLCVATGDFGVLLTSTDGINWTTRVNGAFYRAYPMTTYTRIGRAVNDVIYSNFGRQPNFGSVTSFVDFGFPFKRSTDNGDTWTTLFTSESADFGYGFIYDFDVNGSTILALETSGASGGPNVGVKLKRSTDGGSTWNYVLTLPTSGTYTFVPFSIKTTGSYWLLSGSYMGIYRSTNNGDSWTQVFSGNSSYEFVRGNNIWIAWDSGTGHMTTSSDGITWGGFSSVNGQYIYDIANNGNLWVAVGTSSGRDYIKTSTNNGFSWTVRANSQWGNSVNDQDYLWGVVWAPSASKWVAWGQSALLVVSSDAITWSRTSLVTFGASAVYQWGGVFATSTRIIAYATLVNITWNDALTNPLFIKFVSTDAVNWYVNEIMYDMTTNQDLPTLDVTLTTQPGSKTQLLPIPVVYP